MAAQKGSIADAGAREFELNFYYGECRVKLRSDQAYIGHTEKILVIERAAYDLLMAELAAIKAKKK